MPTNPEDHEVLPGTPDYNPGTITYMPYCMAAVQWAGNYIWLDHSVRRAPPETEGLWMGSLIHNKRDLTGNLYMRNRYYDATAGRFSQEDPIGLAGGLNAYGFAAGDPVSYSDPFGLKVCARSDRLKQRISDTFQIDIEWDSDGCVTKATAIAGSEEFAELQAEFGGLVRAKPTWNVLWRSNWSLRAQQSQHYRRVRDYFTGNHTIVIDAGQVNGLYGYDRQSGGCGSAPWGNGVIAHEFGHAFQANGGQGWTGLEAEFGAQRYENVYNRAIPGRPMRNLECAATNPAAN